MKKIAIIGANGFLGASLAVELAKNPGIKVIGITKSGTETAGSQISHHSKFYISELERIEPDVILNCVALVGHELCDKNPSLAEDLNVLLAGDVAAVADRQGAQMVHFSTDSVFDGQNPPESGYLEDSPTSPFSAYGETKLRGEEIVLENADNALVLRTNFFGWSKSGNAGVLDFFLHSLMDGRDHSGFGRYTVTSGYLPDIADSISIAIRLRVSGVNHLTSSDSLSKLQFGCLVADQFGLDSTLIHDSDPSFWLDSGLSARNLSLSCHKLAEHGVPIPSQVGGLARAQKDLQSAGMDDALVDMDWRRELRARL